MSKRFLRERQTVVAPVDPDSLLDYSQAGALLSMGRTKLSKLVSDGIIPHVKIGANVRFRRSSLLDWVAEKEVGGIKSC